MKIKSLFLAAFLAFATLNAAAGDQIIGYLKNQKSDLPPEPGGGPTCTEDITGLVQEWIKLNPLYKIVTISVDIHDFNIRTGRIYRGVWIVYEKK